MPKKNYFLNFGAKKNKYHNIKIHTDDGVFDSNREYRRWRELKRQQEEGEISDLQKQVDFQLIPTQKRVNPLMNGQKTERSVKYRADFVYMKNGEKVVEDTKGMKTPDYVIKRKLMLLIHKIEVIEV